MILNGCECEECKKIPDGAGHTSDCAVHNEPASPKGECDCEALLEYELEVGEKAATALAAHLASMGAGKVIIPVTLNGVEYTVEVRKVGKVD